MTTGWRWVRTPRLHVGISPDLGGRLMSVRDAVTGREWLVQPPEGQSEAPTYGSSFTERHIHGWDEMFPTIDSCTVQDVDLPDHGEVWAVPWSHAQSRHQRGLRLEARSRVLPLTISRDVVPTDDSVVLDYRLTNHGDRPAPALWAAHPQFHLTPDTTMSLHPSPGTARVVSPTALGEQGWPALVRQADEQPLGSHLKVWLDGPNLPSTLELHDRDSDLRLSWSGNSIQGVAVLWDNACFSRHSVLAVEPSTGCHDSLAAAVGAGSATILAPGERLQWTLTLAAGRAAT